MAKAYWLNVNPTNGSGNASVAVSTGEYYGRDQRTTTLTWTAAGIVNVERTVRQTGRPSFIDTPLTTTFVDKGGSTITIRGTSNAKKLSFSLGTGELNIDLPSTYIAGGQEQLNTVPIIGDPGSRDRYSFSLTLTVSANEGITELSRQIIISDSLGVNIVHTVTLAAGDPYVDIESEVIELDYTGTAVSIAVESNTTWTIE